MSCEGQGRSHVTMSRGGYTSPHTHTHKHTGARSDPSNGTANNVVDNFQQTLYIICNSIQPRTTRLILSLKHGVLSGRY